MKFMIWFLLPLISVQAEWIPFQSMEYYIRREKVTHANASATCRLINGQLVVIQNEMIHNFLVGKIQASFTGNKQYCLRLVQPMPGAINF